MWCCKTKEVKNDVATFMTKEHPKTKIQYTSFYDKTNIPRTLTINGEQYYIHKEERGNHLPATSRNHNGDITTEKKESLALSLYKIATQKEKADSKDVITFGRYRVLENSKQQISLARTFKSVTVDTEDGGVKVHQLKSLMNANGTMKQTNTRFFTQNTAMQPLMQGTQDHLTLNRNESQASLETQGNINENNDISFGFIPNSCQNLRQGNNTIKLLSNLSPVICNEDFSTESSVTCVNKIPQSLSNKSTKYFASR